MSAAYSEFYHGKRVWIIGASSGIGYALALELASLGAHVIASARNNVSLLQLATDAKARDVPNDIEPLQLDVAQEGALSKAIENMVSENALPDTVIFLAGFYQPTSIHTIDAEDLHHTLRVNLWAALEMCRLITPLFYERTSGQIAIAGSVSGYRGLPKGQPYSATKAALMNFAESLYVESKPQGVDVKLISPGFVQTPLTDKNTFTMPDIISAEEAAKLISDGLSKKDFEIHFPKRFTRKLKFLRVLPAKLYFKLAQKL